MEIKIIIQPPYAFLLGLEAINRISSEDEIVVDGIAIHLVLVSFEFIWR